jgi:phospholipid/cholesterol/gamma-HCH transport system substrate-binding protein
MIARRILVIGSCVLLTATGCGFQGMNSLRLPGAVGRGPGATIYHVELPNVDTLESNSPVMVGDVVVGSVGNMKVQGWHADVEISVKPGVVVPANAVASIGQTSLLGSMHVELNPPPGQPATGRLAPGATIPLDRSSTSPSTEQTLSAVSLVVNSGGLGQIGDIIHNFNLATYGRTDAVRDLITRLDTFVGTLDQQRDNIIATITQLNRLADTFAGQRDVITQALRKVPPALDVLISERPRITTALDKLRVFSNTTTTLVNNTQADLVRNLQNLQPTIRALADVGPDLDSALQYATVFPYGQGLVDRGVKGDYMNLWVVLDLTAPALKRGLFLGTRWGEEGEELVPAPGEPGYNAYYTRDPLGVAMAQDGNGGPPPAPQDSYMHYAPWYGAPPPVAPPPGVNPPGPGIPYPGQPPPSAPGPPPPGPASLNIGAYTGPPYQAAQTPPPAPPANPGG